MSDVEPEEEKNLQYEPQRERRNKVEQRSVVKENHLLHQLCHEIRSPLLGVQGLIDRLKQDYSQDLYLLEHLRLIGVNVEQMMTLTDNTLTFAQLQQQKLPLNFDALNLNQWLEDIQQTLSPIAKEKNLALAAQSRLPWDQAWVEVDRVRLTQIANNLIMNALKFTKYGGVSVTLTQVESDAVPGVIEREELPQNWFRLKVEDSGVGMEKAALDKIFKPYVQVSNEPNGSAITHSAGVGLGLSIVLQLVQEMKGRIEVDSKVGEGTRIKVYLPLAAAPAENRAPKIEKEEVNALNRQYKVSAKVLVVDDSAINRKVLESQLLPLGCEVLHASNGEEAVETVMSQAVDYIFMDIQMPILDGVQATAKIRELCAQRNVRCPNAIYALTAGGEEVDLNPDFCRDYHSIFERWLSKPIENSQIIELLSNVQSDKTEGEPSSGSYPAGDVVSTKSASSFSGENRVKRLPEALQTLFPQLLEKLETQRLALVEALEKKDDKEAKAVLHGMKGDAMVFQQSDWAEQFKLMEKRLKEKTKHNFTYASEIEVAKAWSFG
jgi:signal transduction histidine kinase/DNA-binding response OmpR family regulator